MNEESTAHMFSGTEPISTSSQDRLNRTTFAHSVAESIYSWVGSSSLIVGLNGAWGSGKTSLVNLIRQSLNSFKKPPITIEFNPWEWSGHDELSAAFFREIEIALNLNTPKSSKLADRFQAYARVLSATASLSRSAGPLVAAIATLLIVLGGATVLVNALHSKTATGVLLGLGAVGVIASHVSSAMNSLGAALLPKENLKSLGETKQELTDALASYDHNILVVIDDMDRLTPPDAVRLLQLVKANADLPKMVFLLVFDLTSLGHSIAAALKIDGQNYLEKIIQLPIHVPSPDKQSLELILFEGLDEALKPDSIQTRFSTERWSSLFRDGLRTPGMNSYFSTPRRVFRFLGIFAFSLSRQMDGGACNVDPVDFLGIEVLRVFEPAVYDAMSYEKSTLTAGSGGDESHRNQAKSIMDRLLVTIPDGNRRTAVQHILTELFPSMQWAITGIHQSSDSDRMLAQRRVSHFDMFDFYFQMAVPNRSLSEGEFRDTLARGLESKDSLLHALHSLNDRSLLGSFLRDLSADITKIPSGIELVLTTVLFDLGDELESPSERMLFLSDSRRASFIVTDILEKIPAAERLQLLRQAISDTKGISVPMQVLRDLLYTEDRTRPPSITDEAELRALGRVVTKRISRLAHEGSLMKQSKLAELLYDWKFFAGLRAVRFWTECQSQDIESFLVLVKAFEVYASSPPYSHPLEEFIDLQGALDRSNARLETGIANEEAERIRTAVRSVSERIGRSSRSGIARGTRINPA